MAASIDTVVPTPASGETAEAALTRSLLTPEEARRLAWRRLIVATLVSSFVAALLFAGIWYMPFGDGAFHAFASWFYGHSFVLIGAALSPLLASLLVGYGYMTRAMRRRAAEKAAAKAAA